MEVNEVAARLLRRYWLVLLLAIVLPMIAVGALVARQGATYTAHARIVATAELPRSQAEATAVVNQVQALATSRDLITKAVESSNLARSPDTIAKAVAVTGLGSSALVNIAYTDADPKVAQRVTRALATVVTEQLDAVRIGGLPNVLQKVDTQLATLATKRAPIAADAQAHPQNPVDQNRLAGIDRLISDLSGDRDRLAEAAAAAGHASVVDAPSLPTTADSRELPAKLALVGILGLAFGLIVIGVNETIRPSVSGASRVARLLEVPHLGLISGSPAAMADIGRRLRLAARRANVSNVVLVRAGRTAVQPELVDRLEAATLHPAAVSGRVALPVEAGRSLASAGVTRTVPWQDGHVAAGPYSSLSVPPRLEKPGSAVRLRRMCVIDELDPDAEHESIALVVLAGVNTRLNAIDDIRDLMATAGWPLLGVLGDSSSHGWST